MDCRPRRTEEGHFSGLFNLLEPIDEISIEFLFSMLSMVHLSSPPFENVGLDEIDVASAECSNRGG